MASETMMKTNSKTRTSTASILLCPINLLPRTIKSYCKISASHKADFQISIVAVSSRNIKCALLKAAEGGRLVTMIGGIPREVERRQKLPLINKLYGYLALILKDMGISSLLYNQPATGGSGGGWETETLHSRTTTLIELVDYFGKQHQFADHGLIGSSAGAYMAINAVDEIERRGTKATRLILLSPAAYPKEIETVPYGEEFTRILREPWDVSTSPVFPKLKEFLKNGTSVLLSFFEHDDPPIPAYIQEYYRSFLWRLEESGAATSVLTIPGVVHNFRRIEKKRGSAIDDDSVKATAKRFSEFLK